MGNKLQVFRLKWQVYAINLILAIVIGVVYTIFQYMREFFTMYQSINLLFGFLQWVCVGLMIGLCIIVFLQFQKAGEYAFYTNGFVDLKNNQSYYYHDIMTYSFVPENNRQAKQLVFQLDNGQKGSLSALLNGKSFELFQQGHANVWGPFLVQKIDAKDIITFNVLIDVTSFKVKVENKQKAITITHQGITLYDKFYEWETVSRFEMSFTGMMSIKDTQLKTIWLEPAVCVENYYDFIYVLKEFLGRKKNANDTPKTSQA